MSIYLQDELTVMVPADSTEALHGATLDLPASADQGGLVIRNPNRPDPLAGVSLELTGTIAEQVTQLLEQQINPALGVARRVRHARRRGRRPRVHHDGRRLPRMRGQRHDPARRDRAVDQGEHPRSDRRRRRHRPRRRRVPVLLLTKTNSDLGHSR